MEERTPSRTARSVDGDEEEGAGVMRGGAIDFGGNFPRLQEKHFVLVCFERFKFGFGGFLFSVLECDDVDSISFVLLSRPTSVRGRDQAKL